MHYALAVAIFIATQVANAFAESVVEVPSSRGGPAIRALVDKPAGTPLGTVVLLAGGHGNLNISKDGKLGWGKGNQLVRTRADYAKAGFVAIVPDVAADLKSGEGVKDGARYSAEWGRDIGAVVKYARGLAAPVHVVGTSRAAITTAKVGTITTGAERPDSLVITAGMTVAVNDKQPSAERNVPGLGRISQPVFLLHHKNDGCPYTPASAPARFKPMLTGAKKVDIQIIDGGDPGSGNPCEAKNHHGFLGQYAQVVSLVTTWLKALPK
jgi:dienelactone hydrolase